MVMVKKKLFKLTINHQGFYFVADSIIEAIGMVNTFWVFDRYCSPPKVTNIEEMYEVIVKVNDSTT